MEFIYTGYDIKGKKVKGTIFADSINEAISLLKDKGIYIGNIEEVSNRKLNKFLFNLRSKKQWLTTFTRHLSILLDSGVPLVEALDSLSNEFLGKWKIIVNSISERVREGASLSRAINDIPEIFPEYYISIVEAAEYSGGLSDALSKLADFLEVERAINSRVLSAMLYPCFMIIVSVFVLSFVFTFVLPKIVKIFLSSKASLPIITIILIKITHIFQNYWWAMGLIIISGGYSLLKLHKKYPHIIHKLLLKISVFKTLYYSRFTGTLGFMLKGGVPVIKALELSAKSTGNKVLYKYCEEAIKMVSEGANISSSFQGISPVLKEIISVGEKTGNLDELMLKVSNSYREDFIRNIDNITALLEPFMILIMGVIIGSIVFGVLLPIFQMNQLIH